MHRDIYGRVHGEPHASSRCLIVRAGPQQLTPAAMPDSLEPLSFNLKAGHKQILADCGGPNQAFLACKAEDAAPKACINFGCVFCPRVLGWALVFHFAKTWPALGRGGGGGSRGETRRKIHEGVTV